MKTKPIYPIKFMSQSICPITEEACEKFDGRDCTVDRCEFSSTIVSFCCICHKFLEIKDGKGVFGPSHGYCDECVKGELVKMKRRPNNVW